MNGKLARILIVDDHPMVRQGLRTCIEHESGLAVCGEADSVDSALQAVDALVPDLVLLDLSLRDGHGFSLIRRIRAQHPAILLLVVSAHEELLYAEKALHQGASGYVEKLSGSDEIVAAIREVLDGRRYLSREMTQRLIGRALVQGEECTGTQKLPLTGREMEVFDLIGRGMGNREIADNLHISLKTVESHREKIKKKLGLGNSKELYRYAMQQVMEE